MRLRLTIEYDGTPFRGWAAQPGLPTVEGALHAALEATFASYDRLAVAGRTDTGVHALANVASVEVEGGPPADRAREALNAELPRDVSVAEADEANNTAGLANAFIALADNKVTLLSIRSVGQQTEQAFLDLVEKEESKGFTRLYQPAEAA